MARGASFDIFSRATVSRAAVLRVAAVLEGAWLDATALFAAALLAAASLTGCERDFSTPESAPAPALCTDANLPGPELVEVPAGSAIIGANDLTLNSMPVLSVDFEAFCMDRTEVTVADYRACVDEGACEIPNNVTFPSCNWGVSDRDDHPVSCIDQPRAQAYCAWAGKRLPSEREWEYAARGSEGRPFPWGTESPRADLINWNNLVGTTTAVDSYPHGATPDTGIVDMAGNVWEWTASIWCESYAADAPCDPTRYVSRGGSYGSMEVRYVRTAWRDPDSSGDNRFGFRCALGGGEIR